MDMRKTKTKIKKRIGKQTLKESPLKTLQQNFMEALKGKKPFPPLGGMASPVLSSKDLSEIYGRNHFHALFQSLKDTYPGCHCLLEKNSFFMLSQRFISQCPSRDPLLLEYGDRFPFFLKKEMKTQGKPFPFLPLFAKWELTVKKGTLLPSSQPHLIKAYLKDLKKGKDMQVQKSESCLLFCSPWTSLLALWKQLTSTRVRDAQEELPLPLKRKKQYLLLFKEKETLEIQDLNPKTFHLLQHVENPKLLSQMPLQSLNTLSLLLKKGWLILRSPSSSPL